MKFTSSSRRSEVISALGNKTLSRKLLKILLNTLWSGSLRLDYRIVLALQLQNQ